MVYFWDTLCTTGSNKTLSLVNSHKKIIIKIYECLKENREFSSFILLVFIKRGRNVVQQTNGRNLFVITEQFK